MKKGLVSLDTLRLNVKYPKSDIFNKWYVYAKDTNKQKLKEGFIVNDFVIKGGGSGYKLSLCQNDARLFLTDESDEIRGEGNGMGILIQLGPKYLIHHITDLNQAVNQLLIEIGLKGNYPIGITRLDLAIDLFDQSLDDHSSDNWRKNWVGRSRASNVYFNKKDEGFETIYIGSRKSSIYLRIYNKIEQAIQDGDIFYWLDVWKREDMSPVTRVEWEVKPKRGNFSEDLINFKYFNGFSRRELLNYLVEWGRLCIPSSDSNKSRWESAPFWKLVEEVVQDWADGVDWPTSRFGKDYKEVSEAYISQLAGNFSGAMARLGGEDQNLAIVLDEMKKRGHGIQKMRDKAKMKARVYNKL